MIASVAGISFASAECIDELISQQPDFLVTGHSTMIMQPLGQTG
jgi:hypothetical protein